MYIEARLPNVETLKNNTKVLSINCIGTYNVMSFGLKNMYTDCEVTYDLEKNLNRFPICACESNQIILNTVSEIGM